MFHIVENDSHDKQLWFYNAKMYEKLQWET